MSEDKANERNQSKLFDELLSTAFDQLDKRCDGLEIWFENFDLRVDRICKRLDNLISLKDEERRRWEEFEQEIIKTCEVLSSLIRLPH